MIPVKDLADQLGLEVSPDAPPDTFILCGARGTVILSPPMRGILIDDKLHFPRHRVVIEGGWVSVPDDFIGRCEKHLKPRAPTGLPGKKKDPPGKTRPLFHVVLDPGHGGKDPGAVRKAVGHEKTVTLIVSRLIAAKLQSEGVRVTMTRARDTFVDLNERSAIGNRLGADAFVSIHADAAKNRYARGFTAFVVADKARYSDSSRAALICRECGMDFYRVRSLLAENRPRSKRLASLIRAQMRKVADTRDRGTQLGEFRVLERSACPATLVELGFMSNEQEGRRLFRPGYQRDLAAAVAQGILLFLDPK